MNNIINEYKINYRMIAYQDLYNIDKSFFDIWLILFLGIIL